MSILDLISIGFLAIGYFYFQKQIKKDHEISKRLNALPSQFTIYVNNLKENTTVDELSGFFKAHGGTYDIKIARNYKDTLFLHNKQVKLVEQIRVQELNVRYDKLVSDEELIELKEEYRKVTEQI